MALRTDIKLKENIKNHREETFEEIYEEYRHLVMYFTTTKTGLKTDAEDLAQEIFMKVYSNIDDYNPYLSSFKTWLVTITMNHITDFLRQRKDFIIYDNDIVNEACDEPFFSPKFEYAVRTLETVDRDVLVLKVVYNFTHKEIAASLKISIDVSKKKLKAAKNIAKGEWLDYEKKFQ